MHEVARSTAAVFVVYRRAGEIDKALDTLRTSVQRVLVVDNHESAHPEVAAVAARLGLGYLHAANLGGLAGAYNRALAWLQQQAPELRHVVFLDEDSEPATLAPFLSAAVTAATLAGPATAAVAPAYRDRATGLRGRYICLKRWSWTFNPREFGDVRHVAFVINSMSVWRLDVLQAIGPFNEDLAVDHVDTEYCLRARQRGYRVYIVGAFEFVHSIGQRRKYRLLGMEVQAGGHSPERRFMIARNTVWLARTWLWREPAFAALCASRMAYEAAGIVMAEDRALAKLSALLRGAVCGLFGIFEPPARPARPRP